jgi:hypothetical protein
VALDELPYPERRVRLGCWRPGGPEVTAVLDEATPGEVALVFTNEGAGITLDVVYVLASASEHTEGKVGDLAPCASVSTGGEHSGHGPGRMCLDMSRPRGTHEALEL